MRFWINREPDGWFLVSPDLDIPSQIHPYATRRQAITAMQMRRFQQEEGVWNVVGHDDG